MSAPDQKQSGPKILVVGSKKSRGRQGCPISVGTTCGTPLLAGLVMAGVDLRTVQELMGHKTITMTVRYAHLAPAHQREAIERLAQKRTDTTTDTGHTRQPQTVPVVV